jgi:hypothetical protein
MRPRGISLSAAHTLFYRSTRASPVALKQEFGTVPDDFLVFFQDPSVGKARLSSQPNRPFYCGLIIRIRFAIQNRNGIGLVGWRPDKPVGIDKKYGTEIGSLFPAAHALLASTMDCAGNRRNLIFPVLDGGPRNVQVLSRFFLAETKLLAPLLECAPVHSPSSLKSCTSDCSAAGERTQPCNQSR